MANTESVSTIEDVRRELADKPLHATSGGRSWRGIALDYFGAHRVDRLFAPPRDHHVLTVNFGDTNSVLQERCGRKFESPGKAGEATLMPAGLPSRWTGFVPPNLKMRFEPESLNEAAYESRRFGARRVEIVNCFRVRDSFIAHLASIFRLELTRAPHPAQELMIESLAAALSMHLVRSYTNAVGIEERSSMGVGLGGLRRALAYIEDRPNVPISLNELASAAGLSRYYFNRLFRKHLGVTPASYVERSRIERAKTMMRTGHFSLADVAHAVGFADQSHFTRRFRRYEQCTPAAYVREHASRWPRN